LTGTKLERDLVEWDVSGEVVLDDLSSSDYEEDASVYEITAISKRLKNINFLKYIPFFPNFLNTLTNESFSCSQYPPKQFLFYLFAK
jgi:hypothetical protein